ncbi:MAG TPA: choice-of-anchor J domain-containing protein, partial [Flavobacteriales bacterium]|nr:choice-of-anchor J domain-containing protein [Flavobacteriales bacterium]
EGFDAVTFPPTGWNYIHFNKNCKMTRNVVGGFGLGTGSMKMDNYSGDMNITGQQDFLLMPRVDLSAGSANTLNFSVAYAMYNASSVDRLQVKASTDCGETWSVLYDKQGSTLSTAPVTTGAFTPTGTQWRAETVDISSVVGGSDVLFAFVSISNYGNNVFVDDVSIGSTVGMDEAALNDVSVFPVPSNGMVTVHLRNELTGSVLAEVLTIDGKTAHAERWAGASTRSMDLSGMAKGSYVLRLTGVDGEQLRSRLVLE